MNGKEIDNSIVILYKFLHILRKYSIIGHNEEFSDEWLTISNAAHSYLFKKSEHIYE